jgi:hypothetical protein
MRFSTMHATRHSRGQVLLITAFALVVLLAIAAIVVDLGMSWMLHRQEQNAADPGALAAAKWINPVVDQTKMKAEACFYAQQNGFFKGDVNCVKALTVTGDLQVHSPPSSTLSGDYRGFKGYVEVIINATHPSFFGQILGRPFASVKTAAVAANTPGNANSASLTALGHDCTNSNGDNGISTVSGGAHLRIFPATASVPAGGYVQVNASCGNTDDICANGSGTNALKISGTLSATVKPLPAPFVNVVGGCSYQGSGTPQPQCIATLAPCLDEGVIPLGDPLSQLPEPWPFLNLPAPLCPWISGPVNLNGPSDSSPCTLKGGINGTCPLVSAVYTCTMNPGVYYAGWDVQSNVRVVLKPGMYVFAGFGIKLSNGSSMATVGGVDANGNPIEARITIFSTDYTAGCKANKPNFCEGAINIAAQGALDLKATNSTSCLQVSPTICTWRGILLWQDGTVVNTPQDVTITGSSDLILSGTIYAPKSHVKISGANGSTGCGFTPQFCLSIQIIALSWDINGNAAVDMPYDPAALFTFVQRGLVH